jgi:flagellar biosynthesis protein FlhA
MTNLRERLKNIFPFIYDCLTPIGVMTIVLALIIPLPTILLDILIAMNLIICVVIFLLVVCCKKAADFSFFPPVLLMVSVFSFFLNISSTRFILTCGANFDSRIIRAFSSFIIGSGSIENFVFGVAIFIVLIAVQAMVIVKAVTRTAEVAARFALDVLPGKQMAIEADFYGALDGSSKFISANGKAGILISAVNILGGIIIGVQIHGEPIADAVGTYISFAIGAGLLINQYPTLLMSLAAGIILTRSVN